MGYNIPEDATDVAQYTDLGGYPLFYVTKGNDVMCPNCVTRNITLCKDSTDDYYIVAMGINYEDSNLHCEECGCLIESAYGND